MDARKALLSMLALFAVAMPVVGVDTGATINESLMLIVGALPIIVLAITSIVSIVLALVAVIIVIVLIAWFKDILMLPLDIVKHATRKLGK
jgi:hypothetical protein